MSLKKYKTGFTLTELVITMAVAAIMMGMAVPSFNDMLAKKRLKLAAEAVAADFNFYKQEGLKRRLPNFYFNVNAGANWCYGISVNSSCDCATANSCEILQVAGSDYNGISTVTTSRARYDLTWQRGTVTSGGITFNTSRGHDLQLQINPLGRTSVCSPSNNMPEYSSC